MTIGPQCPPAPYADDVRAKGWRLEIDCERLFQSDTWALTPDAQRGSLLHLLVSAWTQNPCGSLPSQDALIAARIGLPAEVFAEQKAVLLRGWYIWRYFQGIV
ncbi:hypothetical protein [Uliginosibacterium sp. TH139]|uniref:hypothetical protein n=1 Tax=Uliginosibacterium sp. TH139 TaxID=2067453 RepID=UPI000C7E438C|nr:hypothetical protein [Uliginosibacterium sp. TH139]PLK47288.1 hypothetical protein C0V76_17845 [Uliginosibacterium sp. TH139]